MELLCMIVSGDNPHKLESRRISPAEWAELHAELHFYRSGDDSFVCKTEDDDGEILTTHVRIYNQRALMRLVDRLHDQIQNTQGHSHWSPFRLLVRHDTLKLFEEAIRQHNMTCEHNERTFSGSSSSVDEYFYWRSMKVIEINLPLLTWQIAMILPLGGNDGYDHS